MEKDWQKIKNEIITETQPYFSHERNFNINETLEIFSNIIDNENLNEIADALQIRYVDQNFSRFETSRTLLAGQFETYVKTVYDLINKTLRGELKACLDAFFDEFSFLDIDNNRRKFFEKDTVTKISSFPAEYFYNKMPYGKEFKHAYDLRNAIIHDGKLFNDLSPTTDNLPYDIKSFVISILFFTYKYSSQLSDLYQKQDQAFLQPYLERVISEFKKWQGRFVHINGREDFTVLDNFAIEQNLKNTESSSERSGTIDYLRKSEVPEKRMIVWGDAGMGKSTTLQYLTFKDANDILLNDSKIPIPVYIPLKLQTDKNISIEQSIFSELSVDEVFGEKLLTDGRLLLLLDGLNEILKDLREQKRREIQTMLHDYPNTFFIISNRPQQYNEFENVPVFLLQKMGTKQIDQFLTKNTDNILVKNKILEQIKINSALEKIVSTPLMLWMLVNVVEERGDIPPRKTILIEEFMNRIYKREAQKDSEFNIDEIDSFLRYLGAESYNINDSNAGMSRNQVERILLKRKEKYGIHMSVTYFLDTVTKLNILAKDGKQFSFAHQEYQTYFAGEELEIDDFLDM